MPALPHGDRPGSVRHRLRDLFGTVASPAVWTWLIGLALVLLAASWLLDRLGLAAWRVDTAFLLGFGAAAALGTALVEEAVFRGILLKPQPTGTSGFAASALSAILFALWHPFQTLFYHPLWRRMRGNGGFFSARACSGSPVPGSPWSPIPFGPRSPSTGWSRWAGRRSTASPLVVRRLVYYISNTPAHFGLWEDKMDFIRAMQAKDWMIVTVAFVAGAWIF